MKQLDFFGFEIDTSDVATKQRERLKEYTEGCCFQFDIRVRNREEDLFYSGLTEEYVQSLTVSDFNYHVSKTEDEKKACKEFISRHEWLGTVAPYTTHYFYAEYKGIMSGVILMSVPNAFSKILGEETKNLERLISRGACISWSPKNLASNFLMWCIKWMVNNTEYRLFTCYSDPAAKELGSIYQACNFYYLGQGFGSTVRYVNPYNGKISNDRLFRHCNMYKLYAQKLGIRWDEKWGGSKTINWSKMPDDVEKALRDESRRVMKEAETIEYHPKHKYAFVLGRNKRETKALQKLLLENNKVYPYPKERGK